MKNIEQMWLRSVVARLGSSPPANDDEVARWAFETLGHPIALTYFLAAHKLAKCGNIHDAELLLDDACAAAGRR
jgi:hypothetical protein